MENRRRFIKGVLGISGGLVAFGNLRARNLYQKSCALCSDIAQCDKQLWIKWPEMKANVLKIQAELKG